MSKAVTTATESNAILLDTGDRQVVALVKVTGKVEAPVIPLGLGVLQGALSCPQLLRTPGGS